MRSLLIIATCAAAAPAHAKLRVVATLPALAALARTIAGPHAEVSALVAPTEDPHFVDARPSLIVVLNKADLLVTNGLDLEIGWLPPLLLAARNPRINRGGAGHFDAGEHIEPLDVPAEVDRARGDVHPGGNPHFWFDPRAGARVALALGARLAQLAPEHGRELEESAARCAGELRAFASVEAKAFRTLPAQQRRVISYHRSFPYLYDWLGIEEVIAIEPRPGIAPDPGHVAKVLALMKREGVRTIVQEEFQPHNTSRTLAELGQGRVVLVPGGPRFAAGQTYLEFTRRIAEELHAALSK